MTPPDVGDFPALARLVRQGDEFLQPIRAALYCASQDSACTAVHLRVFAERVAARVVLGLAAKHCSLYDMLHSREFKQAAATRPAVRDDLDLLRRTGNDGAHGRPVLTTTFELLATADRVAQWLLDRPVSPGLGPHGGGMGAAPRWDAKAQDHVVFAAEVPDGIYLLRRQGDTTVLRAQAGQLDAIRRDAPMLLFGGGDQLWEWEELRPRAPVSRISGLDDYWDARDQGHPSHRAYVPIPDGRFVNLADGRTLASNLHPVSVSGAEATLLVEHPDGLPMGWIRTVRPLPAVGPWLPVLEHDHAYHGGAHSNWTCRFWMADARSGARVDAVPGLAAWCEQQPHLMALARGLWRAQVDPEIERDDAELEAPGLELTAFRFDVQETGATRLVLQFTAEECFAYSDGRWSSYTRSVEVATQQLPPAFQPFARLPGPIADWARENLGELVGWSRIDLEVLELLEARLDHPPEGW